MIKNILKKINDKNKYDGHLDEQYEDTNDIEKQILDKIKKDSEEKYKESIKQNMINYMKTNEQKDITYENWLRTFNILDWEQEYNYVSEKRDNKIYHKMWDNLFIEDQYIIL
jgi:predicted transcriptional regulator